MTGEPAFYAEWAASDDPLRRAHVAALRARRAAHPEQFPPLLEQAGNLAVAVGRFVASGMERATPEQQAERMAVCRGCENFTDGRCRLCGCRLGLKIAMASEHCPMDPPKW